MRDFKLLGLVFLFLLLSPNAHATDYSLSYLSGRVGFRNENNILSRFIAVKSGDTFILNLQQIGENSAWPENPTQHSTYKNLNELRKGLTKIRKSSDKLTDWSFKGDNRRATTNTNRKVSTDLAVLAHLKKQFNTEKFDKLENALIKLENDEPIEALEFKEVATDLIDSGLDLSEFVKDGNSNNGDMEKMAYWLKEARAGNMDAIGKPVPRAETVEETHKRQKAELAEKHRLENAEWDKKKKEMDEKNRLEDIALKNKDSAWPAEQYKKRDETSSAKYKFLNSFDSDPVTIPDEEVENVIFASTIDLIPPEVQVKLELAITETHQGGLVIEALKRGEELPQQDKDVLNQDQIDALNKAYLETVYKTSRNLQHHGIKGRPEFSVDQTHNNISGIIDTEMSSMTKSIPDVLSSNVPGYDQLSSKRKDEIRKEFTNKVKTNSMDLTYYGTQNIADFSPFDNFQDRTIDIGYKDFVIRERSIPKDQREAYGQALVEAKKKKMAANNTRTPSSLSKEVLPPRLQALPGIAYGAIVDQLRENAIRDKANKKFKNLEASTELIMKLSPDKKFRTALGKYKKEVADAIENGKSPFYITIPDSSEKGESFDSKWSESILRFELMKADMVKKKYTDAYHESGFAEAEGVQVYLDTK
ncbi:MAG: hypothetical protein HN576_10970 [Bacteriovoracaceae bacterium]|jgi:hypothetical protein|nr:hypothetical protein [Bacteriovoracaceae bacterium]